ncbi:hypothetical protein [Spirosoma sp. KNUC1025]|uniref:hypothetical protein n=1 Tax=Spirosoma sp. KNUC1025 TaxID=2894082 RepID=UPI00386908D5|nr:hypothetical protein LN737_28310 [Spirosoma sp. KNUC1025]
MKAQLTFLSIFMKVLLLLLILAFCFTGSSPDEAAVNDPQQHSSPVAIKGLSDKDVTDALVNSIRLK